MRFTNLYKIIALFLIILAVFISQFFFQAFFREGMDNATLNTDTGNAYDNINNGMLNLCNTSGASSSDCTNLLTTITASCDRTLLSEGDYKTCAEGKTSDAIAAYTASARNMNNPQNSSSNQDMGNFYDSFNLSFNNSCLQNGNPTDCSNILSGIIQSCSQTNPADYTTCATNISNAYIQNMNNSQNSSNNIPGSSIFSSLANTMGQASSNINNAFSYLNPTQNTYQNTNQNPTSIITTSSGQQILATTQNTVDGIPSSQIPQGQEDLYILKSEIVPPICPACPNIIVDDSLMRSKCQPCPPCERCPEPAFDCKKVPNYSLGQSNLYLPRAILSDFSQFGM